MQRLRKALIVAPQTHTSRQIPNAPDALRGGEDHRTRGQVQDTPLDGGSSKRRMALYVQVTRQPPSRIRDRPVSSTGGGTHNRNCIEEKDMDYSTWPYFYKDGTRHVWLNYKHYGWENPCSGDDLARLKADQRA